MGSDAEILAGVELVNAKGETADGAVVTRGKLLAFYFAADWCPDCRNFQPVLNAFYKKVNADAKQLEIVFVGSDASAEDQLAHFKDKQGPWWAFGVCLRREQEAVGVTQILAGIPALAVARPNGDLLQLLTDADLEKSDGLTPDSTQMSTHDPRRSPPRHEHGHHHSQHDSLRYDERRCQDTHAPPSAARAIRDAPPGPRLIIRGLTPNGDPIFSRERSHCYAPRKPPRMGTPHDAHTRRKRIMTALDAFRPTLARIIYNK
ncbi:hypothetical protein PybrP1_012154, partial [[Pythium] brassicae (nom. inval.)]